MCTSERDVLIEGNGVLVTDDGGRSFCRAHHESLEMKRERKGKSLEVNEYLWVLQNLIIDISS